MQNYPETKPKAYFNNPSHIFHPLVYARTGEINLDIDFKDWQPGKNWAVNVLLAIKKLVHLEPYYKAENVQIYNKDAHVKFMEDFPGYVEFVKESIRASVDERFKNDKSSALKFEEPNALHGIVAQKLNEQIDEIAVDRELELEDEDALIERKKKELK